MKLFELNKILEEKIPKDYSCEWDNDGLMCATDMSAEVHKVLCTLDVTEVALKYAAENGFDTVISHHPMIFRPIGAVTPENHVSRKAIFALQNNINVFSFHTRFDTMPGGINDLLAEKLGLQNVRVFGDGEDDTGRIGELCTEVSINDFCQQLKNVLGCDTVSYSKRKDTVKTVAVLGGSGKDFIKGAKAAGADVLVSGELGYNNMSEAAEMGISLVEAGHFFTENIACKWFSDLLCSLGIENAYFCSNTITTI